MGVLDVEEDEEFGMKTTEIDFQWFGQEWEVEYSKRGWILDLTRKDDDDKSDTALLAAGTSAGMKSIEDPTKVEMYAFVADAGQIHRSGPRLRSAPDAVTAFLL